MVERILVLILLLTNYPLCQSKTYDKFTLYHLIPSDLNHLKFIQSLEVDKDIDVVFWQKSSKINEEVHLVVSPKDNATFLEKTSKHNLTARVVLQDLQKAFGSQIRKPYSRSNTTTYTFDNYHSIEDIYQWLNDIALKYPSIVELINIGKSANGRDIFAVTFKNATKKASVVVVEAGIHGNEWVSIEFGAYLINRLLAALASKDNMKKIAEFYRWYIIPVLNPDGFAYSQSEDRLWKKNRRNVENVFGVDLNRNFINSSDKFDTSQIPSKDNYCGPEPFSEPETKAFAAFLKSRPRIPKYYFSIQAYGEKIIVPYEDKVRHVENYEETENYAGQASLKMHKLNGVRYAVGTYYDTQGLLMSGTSTSWAKKTFRIRFAYTLLLRDDGKYGHALPPDQILPACEEAFTFIKEILNIKRKKILHRAGAYFSSAENVRAMIVKIMFCVLVLKSLF